MREIYLKFDEEERYDVKIETIEEMDKSIFLDSYIQAYKELNIISSENIKNKVDRNNLLAFLGERGSGKTSCMKSFLSLLKPENRKEIENIIDIELKNNIESISKFKFEVLTIIEPSFFSEKVNIIELVVSSMFKNFSAEIEKNNRDYEIKRALLKKFQEIFKNMKYMKCAEEYQNSEIEELMALGTAVDFKTHLNELIKIYLEFFSKDKLVISIDDIDLNTKFAYRMIEDVRKYLSTFDTVIVIALKLEQLKMVIRKEYITENKDLLSNNETMYIMSDVENRVEKYLLKLIPHERRIFLKNPDSYDNVKIFIGNKPISTKSEKFQERILNFIFQKTNVLFLKQEHGVNKIIPTTLRELVGFIAVLGKLQEPVTNDNIEYIKMKNYNFFKEYLYDCVFKDKLTEKEQNIIKNILSTSYDNKNSYILSMLNKLEDDKRTTNRGKNINIIEIITKLRSMENDIYYLSFFIKLVYSNLLYESYHEKRKQNFYDILGKNYLLDFSKYEFRNTLKKESLKKIEEDDKIKILELFILEKNVNKEDKEKTITFSAIAPFHNIIFNYKDLYSSPYLKNFVFRNIEIYEQFYLFLENTEFEIENEDICIMWKNIKRFYSSNLKDFIKVLPNPLKEDLEKELDTFFTQIEKIVDEDLQKLEFFIEEKNVNTTY